MASPALACGPSAASAPSTSGSTRSDSLRGLSSSSDRLFCAFCAKVGARDVRFTSSFRCSAHRAVRAMAPDEEKMTRRSPLDFPIEWDRPQPGRRPDIFPQFSPMKTPLPQPLPCDPPEQDEEEEEEKKEPEEEPDKEQPEKPEKQPPTSSCTELE